MRAIRETESCLHEMKHCSKDRGVECPLKVIGNPDDHLRRIIHELVSVRYAGLPESIEEWNKQHPGQLAKIIDRIMGRGPKSQQIGPWAEHVEKFNREYVAPPHPSKLPMTEERKAYLRDLPKPQRDVGDEVARMLRECANLDETYACGAKFLKVKEKELREKYGHLNPGQQRMNIGNRMRSKWRKEHAAS